MSLHAPVAILVTLVNKLIDFLNLATKSANQVSMPRRRCPSVADVVRPQNFRSSSSIPNLSTIVLLFSMCCVLCFLTECTCFLILIRSTNSSLTLPLAYISKYFSHLHFHCKQTGMTVLTTTIVSIF